MPENDSTKSQLRPDAPVFTPICPIIASGRSRLPPIVGSAIHEGESVPSRRRRKLNTARVNAKKYEKSHDDASRQQSKQNNQHAGRTRKSRRRGPKDRPRQVVSEDIGVEDNSVKSLGVYLPLHEEADFPSLLHRRTMDINEFGTVHSRHVPRPSTWLNSESKMAIIHAPLADHETRIPGQDEFSKLGLEKLSTSRSTTVKSRNKGNAFLSWDDERNEENQIPQQGASTTRLMETNIPISLGKSDATTPTIRRRRQKNMSKMRENWWTAIEQRQLRRRMFVDLRETLSSRVFDPTIDDSCIIVSDEKKGKGLHKVVVDEEKCLEIYETTHSQLEAPINNVGENELLTRPSTLDKIIDEVNAAALGEYLETRHDGSKETVAILDRLVRIDSPDLLRVAMRHLNSAHAGAASEKHSRLSNIIQEVARALMLAASVGSEDCVSIILANWDNAMSLFTIVDAKGCGVFHHCCHTAGNLAVLRLLLCHISGGTKSKHQQLSKALMMRNLLSQTALHLSCECGRVDFVEVFLDVCSTALMAKLLAIEDSRSQTPLLAAIGSNASDVVVCLIMWRGNRNLVLRKTPQAPGNHAPPCPMVWAAKNGNLDMVQLLLQFSDPSGQDYQVTASLAALLLSEASENTKSDGCQLLIQDGGNPFEEVAISHNAGIATSVSIAAKYCGSTVISTLVSMGISQLQYRQENRRRDSKLRQQPDSFFRTMESKENFEKERALSNALVELLYRAWEDVEGRNIVSPHLSSAVSMLMLGATLKGRDIARLQQSMHARSLKPASLFLEDPKASCYIASYSREMVSSNGKISVVHDLDRNHLSSHSLLMRKTNWFQRHHKLSPNACRWLLDAVSDDKLESNQKDWRGDEITLLATDGESFMVHESVVATKSAKLAAAIRFAKMQNNSCRGSAWSSGRPVLHVDISSKSCAWMLEHIYHGSIVSGLSREKAQICQDLLELMIVAEEFLCFSLLQECEMRLLHHEQHVCFCWSCSRAVRHHAGEEKGVADCLCVASGPSCFVDGSTALDVLAPIQHLEGLAGQYSIHETTRPASWLQCLVPRTLWTRDDSSIWSYHGALSALKRITISTILSQFPNVVKSEAFQESSDWNDGILEDEVSFCRHQVAHSGGLLNRILLLQFCLEELSQQTFPPPSSHGAASGRLASAACG